MKKDYLQDKPLLDKLSNIGTLLRQYEFMEECNKQGLEIDKYNDDLILLKLKLNNNMCFLAEYIRDNYVSDDLVEVVHCKDCQNKYGLGCEYWNSSEMMEGFIVYDDDYCSYGVRKDED